MRTVIHGLRLTSVDDLITSDQEHVATRSLYRGLQDSVGLTVNVLSTVGSDGDFLVRLETALRQSAAQRKVVLLSHVSCVDGRLLPVTEAVQLTRAHGGISFIDGAQAVGQAPVDVQALGADFYIGSCHKWLLGPSGVGYLHIQREQLANFNPNWLPDHDRQQLTAALLGEAGTTNLAQRAGVRVAIEQMQQIGLTAVATHCAQLTQQLRDGLQLLPGITLLGPEEPNRQTGLVGFTVQGWSADRCKALVERLYRQKRILIKYQPEQTGLRVSLAAFKTAVEVAALLAALSRNPSL
jgi:cysteine desulfurase/selenocysteine lyase